MNTVDYFDDVRCIHDEAEQVTKFVFTKEDAVAEAVLYRYPDYKTRTVICCSTQSGCPMGCRFCGAGDYFVRNLTSAEIVAQVAHCLRNVDCNPQDIGRLQIMFMSMGEPLLNLQALVPALRVLHETWPQAALLISTSGPRVDIAPVIAISQEIPTVGLQFSVHEASDEARDALVPFRAKMTLHDMAVAGNRWFHEVGRKPFFNYCAHDGNTSHEDADFLRRWFVPEVFEATVSVICERNDGMPATNEYQRSLAVNFSGKLLDRGFNVRVFDPAGQDTIGGGCGQLWFVQDWMDKHPDRARPSIGSGKAHVHVPNIAEAAE